LVTFLNSGSPACQHIDTYDRPYSTNDDRQHRTDLQQAWHVALKYDLSQDGEDDLHSQLGNFTLESIIIYLHEADNRDAGSCFSLQSHHKEALRRERDSLQKVSIGPQRKEEEYRLRQADREVYELAPQQWR
jgi:hypothetical protein